jgi:hypothetical protein
MTVDVAADFVKSAPSPRAPAARRRTVLAAVKLAQRGAPSLGGDPVIDPNTAVTGRTTLFSSVMVFDHEREEWTTWLPVDQLRQASADALVQGAVDAGHDDIRLVLHVSGSREESLE